jgi:acetyltransferase-like isoleucine patch superfamily enzyme
LKKVFKNIHTVIQLIRYLVYYYVLGFEYANGLTSRLSKHTLIRVLRYFGANIGKECDIEIGITFHNCNNYSNLSVGNNCHIGKNCFFDLRSKIVIEDNVVVSMGTSFITHQDINKSLLKEKYPATSSSILLKVIATLEQTPQY